MEIDRDSEASLSRLRQILEMDGAVHVVGTQMPVEEDRNLGVFGTCAAAGLGRLGTGVIRDPVHAARLNGLSGSRPCVRAAAPGSYREQSGRSNGGDRSAAWNGYQGGNAGGAEHHERYPCGPLQCDRLQRTAGFSVVSSHSLSPPSMCMCIERRIFCRSGRKDRPRRVRICPHKICPHKVNPRGFVVPKMAGRAGKPRKYPDITVTPLEAEYRQGVTSQVLRNRQ